MVCQEVGTIKNQQVVLDLIGILQTAESQFRCAADGKCRKPLWAPVHNTSLKVGGKLMGMWGLINSIGFRRCILKIRF